MWNQTSGLDAILIGLIAGILIYFAVLFFDEVLKVDDPVGAISVHLVCGIWGTLAVGIFGSMSRGEQLMHQLTGIITIGAFTVVFWLVVAYTLNWTIGLPVSTEDEEFGLHIGEHGMESYALSPTRM